MNRLFVVEARLNPESTRDHISDEIEDLESQIDDIRHKEMPEGIEL